MITGLGAVQLLHAAQLLYAADGLRPQLIQTAARPTRVACAPPPDRRKDDQS
jgi:hypothetical protein